MSRLAARTADIPHFKFRGVWQAAIAWQQAHADQRLVAFMYGDNPHRNQRILKEARVKPDGLPTGYRPTVGEPQVRQVIAADFARLGIQNVDPDTNVIVTNGVLEGMTLTGAVLLDPGDEVLVPAPYYFLFPSRTPLSSSRMVALPTRPEDGFKLTPMTLRAGINKSTKLLYLNSPLNPVGSAYSAEEWNALAVVLRQYDWVFVLCDDVYESTYMDGQNHVNLLTVAPDLRDRVIICNSLSKSAGLSELRAGWLTGPEDVVAEMVRTKEPMSWATNIPAQEAILAALSDQETFRAEVADMQGKLRATRDLMVDRLVGMKLEVVRSEAGIFLFPKVPDSITLPGELSRAENFAYGLINYGVAVVPGVDAGVPDHFRLTYGLSEADINLGMDNLQRFLDAV